MKGKIITFVLALLLLPGMLSAAGFKLIGKGELKISGVVLRKNATSSETRAAEELVYHLAKASGKKVQILTEDKVKAGKPYIFLGRCRSNVQKGLDTWKMGRNSGVILVGSDQMRIAGNDGERHYLANNNSTGTLFAVYEFLEKYMGVRWLWPGEIGEYIPKIKELTVPAGRIEVKTAVKSSLWRNVKSSHSGWRNRENLRRFNLEQNQWLKRHRFSCDTSYQLGHAFPKYYRTYKDTHPEFFNMLPDGTRRPNPYGWEKGDPRLVAMCVTSPSLIRHIVDDWKKKNPKRRINLNENDTRGSCVCSSCLAADNASESPGARLAKVKKLFDQKKGSWVNELGSLSDRYCQFYLNVQKEADKIDPKHEIMGLVYSNYSQAPSSRIKLNERIILRFCPPYMYPWTSKKIASYKEIFGGWAKTGAKIMFRPNFTWDGSYFPVLYQDVFYDLYTFSAPHIVAVDMDSLTGHYAVQGLVNYVIASLNHDRKNSLEGMKKEFCSAFGKAAPQVRAYLDLMTKASMSPGDLGKSSWLPEGSSLYLTLFTVADQIFTPQIIAQGHQLLEKAAKVPGLDPAAARRVKFLHDGLKNVELTIAAHKEFRKLKKVKGSSVVPMAKAVQKLDEFRASVEHTNAFNMGNIRMLEDRIWPSRAGLLTAGRSPRTLNGWKACFDPKDVGMKEKWYVPGAEPAGTFKIQTADRFRKQIKARHDKEFGAKAPNTIWYFNRLDKIKSSKKVQLIFAYLYGKASIYLNGKLIFDRDIAGDYTWWSWRDAFCVDIPAGILKPEGNTLVVRVASPAGCAGIWSAVRLVYAN